MKAVASMMQLFTASPYPSMLGGCVLHSSSAFRDFLTIPNGCSRKSAIWFRRERLGTGIGWDGIAEGGYQNTGSAACKSYFFRERQCHRQEITRLATKL